MSEKDNSKGERLNILINEAYHACRSAQSYKEDFHVGRAERALKKTLEIIEDMNTNTRPAPPLVGVDKKTIAQVILDVPCPKGLGQFIATKEGMEYLENIEKAILAKFGSPQKESGDFEEDNAILRRIIFDSGAGQTLLKHYESVTATKESAVDCTMLSLVPCVLAILTAGYRKPDPRFVEVGKIKWPKKMSNIMFQKNSASWSKAQMWNEAITACRAAVEKARE